MICGWVFSFCLVTIWDKLRSNSNSVYGTHMKKLRRWRWIKKWIWCLLQEDEEED